MPRNCPAALAVAWRTAFLKGASGEMVPFGWGQSWGKILEKWSDSMGFYLGFRPILKDFIGVGW